MDVIYPIEFQRAVERVLQDEGGYSCVPDDPGGETKFGISKRTYPSLNIASLTRDDAIAIYWRDWWHRYGFDRINAPQIGEKVFDLAVNIGADHAIECLQRALRSCGERGLADDGILGELTLKAVGDNAPGLLLVALRSEAAGYYRTLAALAGSDQEFLAGWLNRAYE